MPSMPIRLMAWAARRLVRSTLDAPTCDLALIRRRMNIRRWLPVRLPRGLTVAPAEVGGVRCDWLTPRGAAPGRVLLYFHGGGYIGGSIRSMRSLAAWLAEASGSRVCAVAYRLAPEHPYPAGLEDALAVYAAVLASGIASARVGFVGDSAGGGLAVAAMLAARDRGLPLPGASALISPWLDLAPGLRGSRVTNAERDDVLSLRHGEAIVRAYAGDHPRDLPYLSPLKGDLHGFPPTIVQASTSEILFDDASAFTARAQAAGVAVTFEPWDDLPHDWQAAVPFAPEARTAVRRLGAFLAARLSVPA